MDLNQSIRKASDLLREVAGGNGVRASTLSRNTGIPWATTARLLRSLEGEGLVFRDPESEHYFLGLELWRLARNGDFAAPVAGLAHSALVSLAAKTGETVNLALVRPGGEIDIVSQIDPDHLIRPTNWIGWRVPLHASAIGKLLLACYSDEQLEAAIKDGLTPLTPATIVDRDALLAELAKVRRSGVALSVDEVESGLTSLAVGSYDLAGRMILAVSVSGPSFRLKAAVIKRATPLVAATVKSISAITSAPPRGVRHDGVDAA